MYLKCHKRFKDGKEHRYWSIVERVRTRRGVIKRQVLYLGEINDAQRAILEKFKAMQMIDVHLPTTDGRNLILPRYTQPEKDLQLLLHQLKLTLPNQPPPRIEELKKKCGADL